MALVLLFAVRLRWIHVIPRTPAESLVPLSVLALIGVANVAKVKVADYDPTAISGIHTATATEAARYTLDGRQVSAPQRGLNIIRLSDGTVRKVIVK